MSDFETVVAGRRLLNLRATECKLATVSNMTRSKA